MKSAKAKRNSEFSKTLSDVLWSIGGGFFFLGLLMVMMNAQAVSDFLKCIL